MSSCSNSLLTLTASAKSTRTRRKLLMYTKLISLYKSYECLWMENHANFFNFALKGEIWDAIAEKMLLLTPRDQEPNPEKWKSLVHTLRYKMELEKVNEEKAKYFKEPYLPPKRKLYTEKLKFVSTHRFDRKAQTDSVPTLKSETNPVEGLASKCMRLGRNKNKNRVSYSNKMKTFETLRNSGQGTFILTPEQFSNLKMAEKKLFKTHVHT